LSLPSLSKTGKIILHIKVKMELHDDKLRYVFGSNKRMIVNIETGDIGIGMKLSHDLEISLVEVRSSIESNKPLGECPVCGVKCLCFKMDTK